jgi:hypothetical protein
MFKAIIPCCLLAGVFIAGCATSSASDKSTEHSKQSAATNDMSGSNLDEAYQDPKTGKITTEDGRVIICKNEIPTGTHLPRKICRWEKDKDDEMFREQTDMTTLQRKSSINVEQPGPP